MADANGYQQEDLGNIISMEHVNVRVPDQGTAILFYVVGLGLTRDPYQVVGVDNMWINVGSQQFHLPTGPAQVIPGHIGLVLPDLKELKQRLERVAPRLAGTQFAWADGKGTVEVTCPWGNRFSCHGPSRRFGEMTLGVPYVEFLTPPGAAGGIARFYREVFGTPAAVRKSTQGTAAQVEVGKEQRLLFRETAETIPAYDGHHIAVYVANFSGPFQRLERRGKLTEGLRNHQFRFQDIGEAQNGAPVFQLEHEVRSLRHPGFHRALVNRMAPLPT